MNEQGDSSQQTIHRSERGRPTRPSSSRASLHGGTNAMLNRIFTLKTDAFFMKQTNFIDLGINVLSMYYLREAKSLLISGVMFRTNENVDAGIFVLGLKRKKLTYLLSYDVNISSLFTLSKGRGGFEISISYVQSKIQPSFHRCPRL